MEGIRGKHADPIDSTLLAQRLAPYRSVLIDIGTGDGRYVQQIARTAPACFAIGIDACREQLRTASRTAPDNALFLIASAQTLPQELAGMATRIVINFPWGSLASGLLDGDPALLGGIAALARPGTTLEARLNADALAVAGWSLEAGAEQIRRALRGIGFAVTGAEPLSVQALRACPTTWAKRLAFGRDPRALLLRGSWHEVK